LLEIVFRFLDSSSQSLRLLLLFFKRIFCPDFSNFTLFFGKEWQFMLCVALNLLLFYYNLFLYGDLTLNEKIVQILKLRHHSNDVINISFVKQRDLQVNNVRHQHLNLVRSFPDVFEGIVRDVQRHYVWHQVLVLQVTPTWQQTLYAIARQVHHLQVLH
jgi:hypothetical protein